MRQLTVELTGEPIGEIVARHEVRPEHVLAWAGELAESLSRLHSAGFVHGAVDMENIQIVDGHAVLSNAGQVQSGRTRKDDFLQFGEVLLALIAAARAESGAETRLLPGIECLTRQYLQPESDAPASGMRKLAMALRLLRFEPARVTAAAPVVTATPAVPASPVATEATTEPEVSTATGPKMMIVFRVVPPEPEVVSRPRRQMKFWRAYWMVVAPASLMVAVGTAVAYALR